jgi:hypothetical protein
MTGKSAMAGLVSKGCQEGSRPDFAPPQPLGSVLQSRRLPRSQRPPPIVLFVAELSVKLEVNLQPRVLGVQE